MNLDKWVIIVCAILLILVGIPFLYIMDKEFAKIILCGTGVTLIIIFLILDFFGITHPIIIGFFILSAIYTIIGGGVEGILFIIEFISDR